MRFVPTDMRWASPVIGLVLLVFAAPSQAQASRVAYESSTGSVMAVTDESPARVLAPGGHPQVSPDGRYVAFVDRTQTHVRLMPFLGGRQRVIARGYRSPLGPTFIRTTWSADSRYVATSEVGNKITLYDTRRRRTSVLRTYPRGGSDIAGLAFSPSGARIAFSALGFDEQSLHIMNAAPGARATLIRQFDGADPVWGGHAKCLAFTLLIGNRYDSAPARLGLSCGQALEGSSGSLRPVRWLSRTRLLGAELIGYDQERAVEVNISTRQVAVVSRPVSRIFDFSLDGRSVLARSGEALTRVPLNSVDQPPLELAPDAVTASWTGT